MVPGRLPELWARAAPGALPPLPEGPPVWRGRGVEAEAVSAAEETKMPAVPEVPADGEKTDPAISSPA